MDYLLNLSSLCGKESDRSKVKTGLRKWAATGVRGILKIFPHSQMVLLDNEIGITKDLVYQTSSKLILKIAKNAYDSGDAFSN